MNVPRARQLAPGGRDPPRGHGGPRHHEPPEMTWLPPELEDGEEPELRPPELELELDPVEVEPELGGAGTGGARAGGAGTRGTRAGGAGGAGSRVELEPAEVDALAGCVDPGKTRATAPAVATLATVTAVVADLTLLLGLVPWPRWPGGSRLGLCFSCNPFCGGVFGTPCANPLPTLCRLRCSLRPRCGLADGGYPANVKEHLKQPGYGATGRLTGRLAHLAWRRPLGPRMILVMKSRTLAMAAVTPWRG